MNFHKAALLHIKFGRCGFGYWRLGNASQLFLWWITITWRMPWLPQAAYMEGWNACWRELYNAGRLKSFDDVMPPTFKFGKPPEDDIETTLRFTKFVSGQTDTLE